jgi:hypothetical protein
MGAMAGAYQDHGGTPSRALIYSILHPTAYCLRCIVINNDFSSRPCLPGPWRTP